MRDPRFPVHCQSNFDQFCCLFSQAMLPFGRTLTALILIPIVWLSLKTGRRCVWIKPFKSAFTWSVQERALRILLAWKGGVSTGLLVMMQALVRLRICTWMWTPGPMLGWSQQRLKTSGNCWRRFLFNFSFFRTRFISSPTFSFVWVVGLVMFCFSL